MASTIMHMAITKILTEKFSFGNAERLMLGAIMPDAYAEGFSKNISHFDILICGNAKKTYDLNAFREKFKENIRVDELYLGYYLHLIQDLVYRDFVYNQYHWNPYPAGNVERLHNDYALLNTYVIQKYHLQNDMVLPEDFHKELIYTIYPFEIERFLEAVNAQFIPYHQGEIFFFTEEMADLFIKEAVDICTLELQALSAGHYYMDEYAWAWDKKVKSLLEVTSNTRDLGGYKTGIGAYTKYHSLIRSDAVNILHEQDITFLTDRNICTVIDMRNEHSASSPFAQIKQFQYYHIPIEEGSDIPKSVSDVPYSYMRIAECKNMSEVFRKISKADTGVLFHCSAGKDRTGVVSAIMLLLAGVSENDIIDNYMITKECNQKRFQLIPRKFPDLDINIVIPHEEYMHSFLNLFQKKYKSAEQYLESIGLTQKEMLRLKEKLIAEI